MRIINKEKLRDWLTREGRGSKTQLAFEASCSVSLIDNLLRQNYHSAPGAIYRKSISRVTGIPEDDLFPRVTPEMKETITGNKKSLSR